MAGKKVARQASSSKIPLGGRNPADVVEARMEELGMSAYRLQKLSGVPQTTLARFLRREGEIVGSSLFTLLSALGLELVASE